MEQVGSQWTDFYGISCLSIFRKSVYKIQDALKSDKDNGTLHEDLSIFIIISSSILPRMRNVVDKSFREN
jgi:hypothetical protein